MKTILKVDLDIELKVSAIEQLRERLNFLHSIKLINLDWISKVELVKKSKYGVRIYVNKNISKPEYILLFQAILGDDYKRTSISMRDLAMNMDNYNRLFDIKRYPDGEYKHAQLEDVTSEVLLKKNATL